MFLLFQDSFDSPNSPMWTIKCVTISAGEMWRLKICMLLTAPTHLPNRVNHCFICVWNICRWPCHRDLTQNKQLLLWDFLTVSLYIYIYARMSAYMGNLICMFVVLRIKFWVFECLQCTCVTSRERIHTWAPPCESCSSLSTFCKRELFVSLILSAA